MLRKKRYRSNQLRSICLIRIDNSTSGRRRGEKSTIKLTMRRNKKETERKKAKRYGNFSRRRWPRVFLPVQSRFENSHREKIIRSDPVRLDDRGREPEEKRNASRLRRFAYNRGNRADRSRNADPSGGMRTQGVCWCSRAHVPSRSRISRLDPGLFILSHPQLRRYSAGDFSRPQDETRRDASRIIVPVPLAVRLHDRFVIGLFINAIKILYVDQNNLGRKMALK